MSAAATGVPASSSATPRAGKGSARTPTGASAVAGKAGSRGDGYLRSAIEAAEAALAAAAEAASSPESGEKSPSPGSAPGRKTATARRARGVSPNGAANTCDAQISPSVAARLSPVFAEQSAPVANGGQKTGDKARLSPVCERRPQGPPAVSNGVCPSAAGAVAWGNSQAKVGADRKPAPWASGSSVSSSSCASLEAGKVYAAVNGDEARMGRREPSGVQQGSKQHSARANGIVGGGGETSLASPPPTREDIYAVVSAAAEAVGLEPAAMPPPGPSAANDPPAEIESDAEDDVSSGDSLGGGGAPSRTGSARTPCTTLQGQEEGKDEGASAQASQDRTPSPTPRILPRVGNVPRRRSGSAVDSEIEENFALARQRVKELRPLDSARAAAELGGLLRQAVLGDWHTCAMPLRTPPRWKVEERAEWDAWVASEGVTRAEAMRIFAAAVDELYCRKQGGDDSGASPDPAGVGLRLGSASVRGGSDRSTLRRSSTGSAPSRPSSLAGMSSGAGSARGGSNSTSSSDRRRRESWAAVSSSSPRSRTVRQKALSATPVFTGVPPQPPGNDARGQGRETFGIVHGSPPPCPPEQMRGGAGQSPGGDRAGTLRARLERMVDSPDPTGGASAGHAGAVVEDFDSRSTASPKDRASAKAVTEGDYGIAKSGVLYKKREIFPGWRPRTFLLDRKQRLLRYYLPSSAKPRGNIPLEGCSVDMASGAGDRKGEAGPDGTRLFRMRLVAGPVPAPIPTGNNASSSSRSSISNGGSGGGGEGGGKSYTLAATSLKDARDWVAVIRASAAGDRFFSSPTRPASPSPATGAAERSSDATRPSGRRSRSEARASVPASSGGGDPLPNGTPRSGGERAQPTPAADATAVPTDSRRRAQHFSRAPGPAAAAARDQAGSEERAVRSGRQDDSEPSVPSRRQHESVESVHVSTAGGKLVDTSPRGATAVGLPSLRGPVLYLFVAAAVYAALVAVVIPLAERVWLALEPLPWVGAAAIVCALGAARLGEWGRRAGQGVVSSLRRDRKRSASAGGARSLGRYANGDRYYVGFWVGVKALETELSRIRTEQRQGADGYGDQGDHGASPPVAVLHTVVKASAEAVLEAFSPGGNGAAAAKADAGKATSATRSDTLPASARRPTVVACITGNATASDQVSGSGSPRNGLVFVHAAEEKATSDIAADISSSALAGETGAQTHVAGGLAKHSAPGVPLLHSRDLRILVRRGPGYVAGVGHAADCLVEVRQTAIQQQQQQQQQQYPPFTSSGTFSAPTSPFFTSQSEAWRRNDLPVHVAVVSDPCVYEGVAALRVTVERVSALTGPGSGVASGQTVTVLEMSVVGGEAVGAEGTGAFARALRQRLLAV